jgi:hypothetical protein
VLFEPEGVDMSMTFKRSVPSLLVALALAAAGSAARAANTLNHQVHLVGTATYMDQTIQLTPPEGGTGGAWGKQPVSLLSSFKVEFTFYLHRSFTNPQADGVAFVIQTQGSSALGSGGGGIGLLGLPGVASVVQTYVNNHVGFTLDANPYDAKAAPADLGAAKVVKGREYISYDAVNHVLSMNGRIVVDGQSYHVEDLADVDLASLLASDTAYFGFTASTGANFADQRIASWRMLPN